MASLIFNNRVIAVGTITEDGSSFTVNSCVYHKNVHPGIFKVNEEPENTTSQWVYTTSGFILDQHDISANVPSSVTMRQARLALLAAGLYSSVQSILDAIPDATQKAAANIEWEYAADVQRSSTLVATLSNALGLTKRQTDELFINASKIPA